METFIVLGTYTDEGRRHISSSRERLDIAKSVLARIGGKMKEFYLTMGGGMTS
jgi:uncharacterized protein with GYD domain